MIDRRHPSRRARSLARGLRSALLLFAATLSGCSWVFVPRTPEKYEQQGMPCNSSYSWPIADAGMAGLVVPGAAIGTIYALQKNCQNGVGVSCNGQVAGSIITGVVGLVAVFMYIAAHNDGMKRVTRCRAANIRYRFSQPRPEPPPGPQPQPGAAPVDASDPAAAPAPAGSTEPDAAAPPEGFYDLSAPVAPDAPGDTVGATVPVTPAGGDPTATDGAGFVAPDLGPPGSGAAEPAPSASAPPTSGGGQPRSVSFHDSALDELGRLETGERKRLRAAARALSTHPYPLETVSLSAPWEGRQALPVTGTGRALVYRVAGPDIVVEAIFPLAALGLTDPAAAAPAAAPAPSPAKTTSTPVEAPPREDADGFIPPP